MRNTGRDNRPHVRPVLRVELSDQNIWLRVVLIAAFLAIGIGAIGFGFHALLETQPGWEEIRAAPEGPSWAEDFVLKYDFSGGGDPNVGSRQLTQLYTQASEEGYRLFSPEVREADYYNVGYLNAHPNEAVSVEPALYRALEQVMDAGSRSVFLAPAAEEYNGLFQCTEDLQAALEDPRKNGETQAWLRELSGFLADPNHIRLERAGEGAVKLAVSRAYLDFAGEYGIETFLDFGFLQNAFLIDYLADCLSAQGFTNGYLASFDGYTRNLDSRGGQYELNLFHREGQDIYLPGKLSYQGPMSAVTFRDYPMSEKDRRNYYAYQTGETVSRFLDPADCRSKASTEDLTVYSASRGCGELALRAAEIFVADSFRPEALMAMAGEDIRAVWFEGRTLRYTGEGNPPELLPEGPGYTLSRAG